jgi:FixJ family two-component response regulator
MSAMADNPLIHAIDDDLSVRTALDCLFRTIGLACQCHASVAAFLAAARPDVPGCLMLDVRMLGTGGLDFQDRLDERGISLPVALMSGHGDGRRAGE